MTDHDSRFIEARDARPSDPREDAAERDVHDVLTRGLDLPRGHERESVWVGNDEYRLRGSEVRALATIGTFRVVPASDLRDDGGRPGDLWQGEIDRLRRAGLVRSVGPADRHHRTALLALTDRGRELLDSHRHESIERPAASYDGRVKTRELAHDSRLHQAFERSAYKLHAQGARLDRVVLDDELKREYQQFLQDANRERSDSDGRPTRTREEIDQWAREHALPVLDGHVQFPDVRIEYETVDGRREIEDVEVWTQHYRGAHAAAKGRSGFTGYRSGGGGRAGTRSGRAGGGRPFDPDVAAEFLE